MYESNVENLITLGVNETELLNCVFTINRLSGDNESECNCIYLWLEGKQINAVK